MPTADDLLPFLRQMDSSRVYVNGGQHVRSLELALRSLVGNPCTLVSNGTVSIELALRALNLPSGSAVVVPAVTYVASAQAIVNAGLVPLICDVDPLKWQLTPDIACDAVLQFKVRAVMPVATFGAPVRLEQWEEFSRMSGLPIVIDAAGAIYTQQASRKPSIAISYSLHATKALGAGEGGLVASSNVDLLARISSLANFGYGGTNAKMSEYHAAVGRASLLTNNRMWMKSLASAYAAVMPAGIACEIPYCGAATLFPVLLPEGCDAFTVGSRMARNGIETKQWYRPFLNERAEFLNCPKIGPLETTMMLRTRMLGLPWHAHMTAENVIRVCSVLSEAIK